MNMIRRIILAATLMARFVPAFGQAPPAVPALPDAERRTTYTLSSSTCACAVNFALYGDSTDYQNWIEVFLNGVRVNYNDSTYGWTITSPTGSIGSIPRPITDALLTFTNTQTGTVQIVGARRPRRTAQFTEGRGVAARDLNQAITDLVAMLREDWDKINDVSGRSVLAPPGETIALLPSATTRANLGACFDGGGNLSTCTSVPSSTFSAGTAITFSGTNPTTISFNPSAAYQAGAGIMFTGSNPIVISSGLTSTSSISGSTTTYAANQNQILVKRSNSGSQMADLLPGTGSFLPANTLISVENGDASAMMTIAAASGGTLHGGNVYNGFLYLGPNQIARIYSDGSGGYFVVEAPTRAKLGANTTINISTTGSDANSGLMSSTAFATVNKAWAMAQSVFDLNGFVLTFQLASGTYAQTIVLSGLMVGQNGPASVIVQGNTGTPLNVGLPGTGSAVVMTVDGGAQLQLQGVTLSSTSNQALVVTDNSVVNFQNNVVGATGLSALTGVSGGVLRIIGNYTVGTVSASNEPVHWNTNNGGRIAVEASGITITITGAPAWGTAFAFAQTGGTVFFDFVPTFSGTSSGVRCTAQLNGVVNTAGNATSLPGSSNCTTATGGQVN